MSSFPPIDTRSRPRFGILGLAFVLTFLAGLAVAAWTGRRFGWFAPRPAPAEAVRPGAAPVLTPGSAAPPRLDLDTLTAREAALAAQLAALEARLPAVLADARRAGAEAGRAEALLVASAARRALDRGAPLGRLEERLRARFGATDPRAVGVVLDAARRPVTLEDLRLGFDAVAPELRTGARDGVLPAIGRELRTLVVLRRSGSPSPLPAERVERARRLLDGGQVEAALAEARTLPGAARAGNWMEAAGRYAAARRALDALEETAVAEPVVVPVSGVAAISEAARRP